jgi:hypothetical protein
MIIVKKKKLKLMKLKKNTINDYYNFFKVELLIELIITLVNQLNSKFRLLIIL